MISNDSAVGGITLAKALRSDMTNPLSINDIYNELGKIQRILAMPELALTILQLTQDPDTIAPQLAQVIERDPSVTAQVLRYASSPCFGF